MTTTTFDPRPMLRQALDQTEQILAGVRPEQLTAPTPCEDFDVQQLIEHLQMVALRIGAVLGGKPFFETPAYIASGDDLTDWRGARETIETVLTDDSLLTRTAVVPWGEVPGAAAAAAYIGELTVHGWDLATATGQQGVLNPDLAAAALPAYQMILPPAGRGDEIPFGDSVQVPEDAPAYDRLVAWTGRDPLWQAA